MSPTTMQNLLLALDAGAALLARAGAWNTATRDAVQEGRDLNDAEMAQLRADDDASDQRLQAAIAAAKAREAAAG